MSPIKMLALDSTERCTTLRVVDRVLAALLHTKRQDPSTIRTHRPVRRAPRNDRQAITSALETGVELIGQRRRLNQTP